MDKKKREGKLGEVKKRVRKPKKICPDKLVKYINENQDAYLAEIAEEIIYRFFQVWLLYNK